jgi:quercetin dioxygenase-like cupin family protein
VSSAQKVQVLPLEGSGPTLSIIDGEGSARAVVWPGLGAIERSIHRITLGPLSRTTRLEHHGEAVYYVMGGSGSVQGDDAPAQNGLVEGSMVHIEAGTAYRFGAGADGLEFFGGPCPADPALYAPADQRDGSASPPPGAKAGSTKTVTVLHRDRPALMLPLISSDARMIVWPGMGAWTATMNYVRMQPGEENTAHSHQVSEDTIVILEGRGSIDDITNETTHEFAAGDVIHVPAKVHHAVRANRGESVVSAGGPCPADLAFLRLCGAQIPERKTTILDVSD